MTEWNMVTFPARAGRLVWTQLDATTTFVDGLVATSHACFTSAQRSRLRAYYASAATECASLYHTSHKVHVYVCPRYAIKTIRSRSNQHVNVSADHNASNTSFLTITT